MKRIYTGFAADPSPQQPFTTKSLDFVQDANKEMLAVIAKNLIISAGYNPNNVPYLIEKIQAYNQAIYYQGEIYMTNVVSTSPTDYAIIDTTPDATADPLLFTDSINRNVHNDRILTLTNIATGALFNFGQVIDISNKINTTLTMLNGWNPYQVAPSYKISNRQVVLSGNSQTGAGGPTASTLCVVPAPSVLRRIGCTTTIGGTLVVNLILIDTAGNMTLLQPGASVINQINFDGISYAL